MSRHRVTTTCTAAGPLTPDGLPWPLDDRWRTETVVGIATGIRDDRAFERLPILADALEEAGCTDLNLLAHCRNPITHEGGCWALGLALDWSAPEPLRAIAESPRPPINWSELWKRLDDGADHPSPAKPGGFGLGELLGPLTAAAVYLWVVGMILYAVAWFVSRR